MKMLHGKTVRFYRLLLNYALIVIVLFAIIFPTVMTGYLRLSEESANENIRLQLDNAAKLLDRRLVEMDRLANRVANNVKLRNVSSDSPITKQLSAIEELNNYHLINTFVSDLILFSFSGSSDNQIVITNRHTYEIDSYFQIVQFGAWTRDEMERLHSQSFSQKVLPVQWVCSKDWQAEASEYLISIYSVPQNSKESSSLLMLQVPVQNLQPIAQMALGQMGGVFRLSYEDTLFYQYSDGEIEDINLSSDPLLTFSVSSATSKWKYEIAISRKQLSAPSRPVRAMIVTVMLLLFVAGMMLSYYLANRQYHSIRHIAGKLETKASGRDEFELLSNGIDDIIKSNRELSVQVSSQNQKLLNEQAVSLLMGTEEHTDIFQGNASGVFSVLLVSVDNADTWKKDYSIQDRSLIAAGICEKMELIALEFGNGYTAFMPDGINCALLLNTQDESTVETIAKMIQELICKYYDFTVTIGVSNAYPSVNDFHTCYLEASTAVQHRITMGGNKCVFYAQTDVDTNPVLLYTQESERQLVAKLHQGKSQEACAIIRNLLTAQRDENRMVEEMILTVIALMNTLMQVQNEFHLKCAEQQTHIIRLLKSGWTITFDQMLDLLCNLTEIICENVRASLENSHNARINRMIEMANERYSDPSFCLNDVADTMGLSASYTTLMFKEATGESLMNYVDSLRMRHAVVLLETTHLPLREIITRVGYTDQTNFIRKFKAAHQITPSAYRQEIQGKRSEESIP